jgi:DNA-binding transcriptional LysR family regulator
LNLVHLKYAVEVARCGSINKAADNLYMGQPNLSRAIKELETSLGISIFQRSSKGMVLTPEGERFITYAQKILKQVDEIEELYKSENSPKQRFSISVPRASYISYAFSKFTNHIRSDSPAEIFYKETNSMRVINNILKEDYRLGIIRYSEHFDKYFRNMLEEKGFAYETVTDFSYILLMSCEHKLALKSKILYSDLKDYIEIAHADPYVPSLPFYEVKKEELPDDINKRIFIFERASQFELLSSNTRTFMWVSPLPYDMIERYDLVQRMCEDNTKVYKDVLIYKKDYKLTNLDQKFIDELIAAKDRFVKRDTE